MPRKGTKHAQIINLNLAFYVNYTLSLMNQNMKNMGFPYIEKSHRFTFVCLFLPSEYVSRMVQYLKWL